MKTKTYLLAKILVIIISVLFINITVLCSYNFTNAAILKNEDLWPEVNTYWVYEKKEFVGEDVTVYNYNISLIEEKLVSIENIYVPALIYEGSGKIVQWPPGLEETDLNDLYIRKVIIKNNTEIIKYTQYLTLKYLENDQYMTNYDYRNITYNYTELTKPDEISPGRDWTKKSIETKDVEFKIGDQPPEHDSTKVRINSTYLCDRIDNTTVRAGNFETFLIIERQWFEDQVVKIYEYYYSNQTKSYVKMVVKDINDNILEVEELIEYKIPTTGNGPNNNNNHGENDNDKEKTDGWLDLGDRNVQIYLGIIFIIIVCLIIGLIVYKRNKELKEFEEKLKKKELAKKKKSSRKTEPFKKRKR